MSIVAFDTSILTNYYLAKAGLSSVASASTTSASSAAKAPTAPWNDPKAEPVSDLVSAVIAGGQFVNPSAAKLDSVGPGAADYKDLFALHQGVIALAGLAQQANAVGETDADRARLQTTFAAGLSQVSAFLAGQPFNQLAIADGSVAATATTTAAVKRESDSYTTGTIYSGSATGEVPAFAGDVKFALTLSQTNKAPLQVNFDLSELNGAPRTLSNVVNYLNTKLAAAGVSTRFASVKTAAVPDTVVAGGKTITLSPGTDSYALQLKGAAGETASFSAPAARPAVYLAAAGGTTAAPTQSLVKLDGSESDGEGGKILGRTLPAGVTSVGSTVTGSDGSLYVLANITGPTADKQSIKGSQDVALLKYDSAGNLSFTRTLGAASTASGYALALSPDGKSVAVAGSVTGALDAGDSGADAATADSFVTVYDSQGVEQWTQRRGAAAADSATSVAFGADGSVYVAGQTSSRIPGASTAQGGTDAYLEGFSAKGAPQFGTQFGTSGGDRAVGVVAVAGGVAVASVENGHAVVRRFDTPAVNGAAASTVRDLGDLQGGDLSGLASDGNGGLVLVGSTHNGALAGGQVTQAYDGGREAFVASLSGAVAPSAADRLSYVDLGGDATTTGLSVAGGQVYFTGQAATLQQDGGTAKGAYAVGVDPLTGQVGWTDALTGKDAASAPTAITVDPTGASALDKLGLPRGTVPYTSAQDVVSATSLRPGDQFTVKAGSDAARTVTVEAGDTLSDLATKINRASGFKAAATVVSVNGFDQLKISPSNSAAGVTLSAGPAGRDALASLGLPAGLISSAAASTSTSAKAKPYALNLTGLQIGTADGAKAATTVLAAALTTIRKAYTDFSAPPAASAATAAAHSTGATAYQTAQIANYQLALSRLTA